MNEEAEIARIKLASVNFHLISIKQISEKYGISIRTLRRMQAAGKMPTQHKHGRRKMYQRADVDAVLANRGG